MPQIFEFHFNPKNAVKGRKGKEKETADFIFDSFCFEPTNIYEKRVGSLYLVGLLKNALPQNSRFLDVLAEKIKEKYYKAVSIPPAQSLKETLKTANEYLEKIAKSGDVSWLGNLSFSVVSISPSQKHEGKELNFTKIGDLKIILIRNNQITDIDENLKLEGIEPYPLKIFGNIVSGDLIENDILIILNSTIYDFFSEEKLLNKIARNPIEKINTIISAKKEKLQNLSGICLVVVLNKEKALKEKETFNQKRPLFFSFDQKIKSLKSKISTIKITLPKITFLKNRLPEKKFPKINLPKKFLPEIKKPIIPKVSHNFNFKKNLVLIFCLIALLSVGFYIFEKKEKAMIEEFRNEVSEIESKVSEANHYFNLAKNDTQKEKEANRLNKEAWLKINSLSIPSPRIPSNIKNQISEMKKNIYANLTELNNLEEISEPELVFEFKAREFIPRKIIFFENNVFFFNPNLNNIFNLSEEKIIETDRRISSATIFSERILFFSNPNEIISIKDSQVEERISLEEVSFDAELISLNSYLSHLYLLDTRNNLIIRYPFSSGLSWRAPELWFAPEVIITSNLKSMAIDGSIWILNQRNLIEKYRNGRIEKTINLDIFPSPRNFSKIFTSPNHAYIYVLEPAEKRIIIIDKSGQVIKQFQSEKFNNLLDFTVSDNGKEIYLLNGLSVYKINFLN